MQESIPKFMTIRETARTKILPENLLRQMEKQGKLACIYAGKKCLVNFDLLVDQLTSLSKMEAGK